MIVKITEKTLARIGATVSDFDEQINAALDAAEDDSQMEKKLTELEARLDARLGNLETALRNLEAKVDALAKHQVFDKKWFDEQVGAAATEAGSRAVTSILAKTGAAVIHVQTAEAEPEKPKPVSPAQAFEAAVEEGKKEKGVTPAEAVRKAMAADPKGYKAWLEAIHSGDITPKARF